MTAAAAGWCGGSLGISELVLAVGAAEAAEGDCDEELPLVAIRDAFQSLLRRGYPAQLALRLALRMALAAEAPSFEPAFLLVR